MPDHIALGLCMIAVLRRFVILWLVFTILAIKFTHAQHEASVFGWKG